MSFNTHNSRFIHTKPTPQFKPERSPVKIMISHTSFTCIMPCSNYYAWGGSF